MTDHGTAAAQARLLATRGWHRARRPLTVRRAPYMALSRRRASRASLLVRPESVLTIEAPMRSGNTFAVAAFWLSNGREGHVGRHIHAAAHVLESVRLGVPVLVIVRDPRAAAVSHVLRRPALTVRDSLIDYALFFEAIEAARPQIAVASFEDVTGRFDRVVGRLNDTFGTRFVAPTVDDEFYAAATALIEEMNRAERAGDGEVDEMKVARPSDDREAIKHEPRRQLEDVKNSAYVARALAAYQNWLPDD